MRLEYWQSIQLNDAEFGKISPICQTNSPQARILASADTRHAAPFAGAIRARAKGFP
jgi:arginine/lysine/ornithine decarboxylase